jgi:hypothetical protein
MLNRFAYYKAVSNSNVIICIVSPQEGHVIDNCFINTVIDNLQNIDLVQLGHGTENY